MRGRAASGLLVMKVRSRDSNSNTADQLLFNRNFVTVTNYILQPGQNY